MLFSLHPPQAVVGPATGRASVQGIFLAACVLQGLNLRDTVRAPRGASGETSGPRERAATSLVLKHDSAAGTLAIVFLSGKGNVSTGPVSRQVDRPRSYV